jgi:hypothetical protein
MKPQIQGLKEIQDRLLNLERQNRRFKQLWVAVLIASASLIVMGQMPSKKAVEANEFILRDDGGNIRARLFMTEKTTETIPGISGVVTVSPNPMLALYNEKGTARVVLDGEGFANTGSFIVSDSGGQSLGSFMAVAGYGAMLGISNGKGDQRVFLEPGHLELSDNDGFKAGLGVEKNLVTPSTGATHQTSAASLLLFDKNKNVIWKAP